MRRSALVVLLALGGWLLSIPDPAAGTGTDARLGSVPADCPEGEVCGNEPPEGESLETPLPEPTGEALPLVADDNSCACPEGTAGPEDRYFYRPFVLENGQKGDVIAHIGTNPLLGTLFHAVGSKYTHVQLMTEDKAEITHYNAIPGNIGDHVDLLHLRLDPEYLGNIGPGLQTRTFDWSVRSYGLNLPSLVVLKPHDRALGMAAADRGRTLGGKYKLGEFSHAQYDGWWYGPGAQCASFVHQAFGGAIPQQYYPESQRVEGSHAIHNFAYRLVKDFVPGIVEDLVADRIAGQVVMCFTGWDDGRCADTGEKWKENPGLYVGSGSTVSPDDLVYRSGSVFDGPQPAVWSGGDFRRQPMCFKASDPDNPDYFVEPTCINYPPSVALLKPTQRSGRIAVIYKLYDRDSDPLSISVSYCDLNAWLNIPDNCHPASVYLSDGPPVTSSPAGIQHSLAWKSNADLVGLNSVERKIIYMEVSDGKNPPMIGWSDPFPVDNTRIGPAPITCPNQVCDPGSEDSWNCPEDCPAVCSNGTCDNGETSFSCPQDCGQASFCGDGECTEDCFACPIDCSPTGGRHGCPY